MNADEVVSYMDELCAAGVSIERAAWLAVVHFMVRDLATHPKQMQQEDVGSPLRGRKGRK